jgi:formylglycine-generating enzyme required for sulfatase activity
MRPIFILCLSGLILCTSFTRKKKNKPALPAEFVFIQGGLTRLSAHEDSSEKVRVDPFYISRYEVSNAAYRQFYNEVAASLSSGEKDAIACDTTAWTRAFSYGGQMEKNYFNSKDYDHYPVVNISYEGAVRYCSWLQQKIQFASPGFIIEVKLPSRAQWIWAAMGNRREAMFPWANYYLRNRKGEALCNYKQVNDNAVYRNRQTGKAEVAEAIGFTPTSLFTTPVKSFTPNDYGLYNMCGNAAEMITEKGICVGGSWNDFGGDIQIRAWQSYKGPVPTVGFRPVILITEKQP